MKSSIIGPLLLILLSSSVAFGLGSVVKKEYTHFKFVLSWKEAQSFCKSKFTDLATIDTWSDMNSLNINDYHAWIGLHKTTHFGSNWGWSDGEDYNVNLWQGNSFGNCAMVQYSDKKIYVEDCGSHRFFICRKYLSNDYEYPFIPEAKTWPEAWEYCKTKYTDLASFSSSYLNNVVREMEFPIWIGLHRDGVAWTWTWGVSEYGNWSAGEPSNSGDCGSIYSISKKMASQNCDARLPFLCVLDSVILVKENKSWEEALEHCRGLRSPTNNLHYDFLSLQPEDQQDLIMTKVMQADTEEVGWLLLKSKFCT
ncbi:secretory phospholipase A2 receptor-like [Fundulus heteroclitus]|uniref:secretory phospholipase A2 receptor-like n=1 Tax=Fundulus heteroclitus TaxID=8078 RepID=UPI00165A5942|nr:secretory phospholipase A2 receptor-like [Fundulus heteroclitus]